MTKEQIIDIQRRVGTAPDGIWGPKSTAACKRHLAGLMPSPHPFPEEENVTDFYGPHGVPNGYTPPTKVIKLPFTVYFEGSAVNALRPHEKCADSLLRVFERLAVMYPCDGDRRAAGILTYDGLYNPRPKRGGNSWSMHSWAIAIDIDADRNGNLVPWPTKATMPLTVMECFAREGWMAAGAFWSRDAMHFQSTAP